VRHRLLSAVGLVALLGAGLQAIAQSRLDTGGLTVTPVTAVAQGVRAEPVAPLPGGRVLTGPIQLDVDATDLHRRVMRVRETLPLAAGPVTLYYPKFLPGTHGPWGQVRRLAGLVATLDGQRIEWLRDTVDTSAFHLTLPAAGELTLEFQYLSALDGRQGRVVMAPTMLNLQWNSVVLYPAGADHRDVQVRASAQVPAGWQAAGALPLSSRDGDRLNYDTVSLETLVDSPLFVGRHMKRVLLDPEGHERPVALNIMADEPRMLEATPEQLDAHRRLVQQADRLFASRHYGHYEFLLAISAEMDGIGLEHHESSENSVEPGYFDDWDKAINDRELLPHEYVHSWNGKFRRPADLWTPDYQQPMQDSLLWVYEGQTEFWGWVLAARSGLTTPEQARDQLAQTAAWLDVRSGRTWRNLQDTTNAGNIPDAWHTDWRDYQRGFDYYDESLLIWLDADTLIREATGGAKSMDDFARAFFGVQNGRTAPLTYQFDDVVRGLNDVLPHDWAAFLRQRLDSHGPGGPLEGLARAGWKLGWAETPSAFQKASEHRDVDFWYSLGLSLKKDGVIRDVRWGTPAFEAGLRGGLNVLAVNELAYDEGRLARAITANKDGSAPIALLLKDGERYRTVTIDYRGGLRYPRLERIEGTPDRLDAGLLAPRPK